MMQNNLFKSLRKAKHLTQDQVAEMLGITGAAVSKWENGLSFPDMAIAKKVAEIYECTIDELMRGERIKPEIQYVESDRAKKFIRIPVLGKIPAGIPIEAIQDIEDWEDFPISATITGRRYFCLKIQGDSMEPEYRDGDTIIIQEQDHCNSGDDCAVMVNGDDATFKRVRLHENGITLQPLNLKYEPKFYTSRQVESLPIRIIGIVVEIRRKIRR